MTSHCFSDYSNLQFFGSPLALIFSQRRKGRQILIRVFFAPLRLGEKKCFLSVQRGWIPAKDVPG